MIYYAGTIGYLQKTVHPLFKLLRKSKEVERVVLAYLLVLVPKAPVCKFPSSSIRVLIVLEQDLFSPYYSRFLLRTDDIREVKRDKIQLLLKILTPENYGAILREFIVRLSSKDQLLD